jgi:hypothetical protein
MSGDGTYPILMGVRIVKGPTEQIPVAKIAVLDLNFWLKGSAWGSNGRQCVGHVCLIHFDFGKSCNGAGGGVNGTAGGRTYWPGMHCRFKKSLALLTFMQAASVG